MEKKDKQCNKYRKYEALLKKYLRNKKKRKKNVNK